MLDLDEKLGLIYVKIIKVFSFIKCLKNLTILNTTTADEMENQILYI